jgi:hypothetical protein
MARYSPDEYLVAMGEADEDNGLRRIRCVAGGGRAISLLMVSFLVFLDDDGRAGTSSREVSGKGGKGREEETSAEASGVSDVDTTDGGRWSSSSVSSWPSCDCRW